MSIDPIGQGVVMRILVSGVLSALCMTSVAFAAATPQTTVSGMKNPESVCYGQQGLPYVM